MALADYSISRWSGFLPAPTVCRIASKPSLQESHRTWDRKTRNCKLQTSTFALLLNVSYLIPKWILLCTASSNTVTLLVVKIKTPWKYSRCRKNTDTRALCCKCWRSRASRKTSASSRSRIALHRAAKSRNRFSDSSSLAASSPRSLAVI